MALSCWGKKEKRGRGNKGIWRLGIVFVSYREKENSSPLRGKEEEKGKGNAGRKERAQDSSYAWARAERTLIFAKKIPSRYGGKGGIGAGSQLSSAASAADP